MEYGVEKGNKAHSSVKKKNSNKPSVDPKSQSALHCQWSCFRLHRNNYSSQSHNNPRYIVDVNIQFSANAVFFSHQLEHFCSCRHPEGFTYDIVSTQLCAVCCILFTVVSCFVAVFIPPLNVLDAYIRY